MPLRGIGYAAALVARRAVAGRDCRRRPGSTRCVPWYVRDLGAADRRSRRCSARCASTAGRCTSPRLAALAHALGPRRFTRLAPRRGVRGRWRPPPVLCLPDGSDGALPRAALPRPGRGARRAARTCAPNGRGSPARRRHAASARGCAARRRARDRARRRGGARGAPALMAWRRPLLVRLRELRVGALRHRGRCSRSSRTATTRCTLERKRERFGSAARARSSRSRPTSSCCASRGAGTRRAELDGAAPTRTRGPAPGARTTRYLDGQLRRARRGARGAACRVPRREPRGAAARRRRVRRGTRRALAARAGASAASGAARARRTASWRPSELERLRVRADEMHARLAAYLDARPARTVEVQWLVRRAFCARARRARGRRAARAAGARVRAQRRRGARAARGGRDALERQLRRGARARAARRVRARRELAGAAGRRRAARARRLSEPAPRADVRAGRSRCRSAST